MHDLPASEGAQDAEQDVRNNTVSGASHDLPGQPTCY
jgi:hypothetical protein